MINLTADGVGSIEDSHSDSLDDDSEEESDIEDIEVPQGVQAEIDTDFKYVISFDIHPRVRV